MQYRGHFMSHFYHKKTDLLLQACFCCHHPGIFFDCQTGIEKDNGLGNKGKRRQTVCIGCTVITGIGVTSMPSQVKANGPCHVEPTGHNDRMMPAMGIAQFFGKTGIFCCIPAFSSLMMFFSSTPRDRSIRFSMAASLASPANTTPRKGEPVCVALSGYAQLSGTGGTLRGPAGLYHRNLAHRPGNRLPAG